MEHRKMRFRFYRIVYRHPSGTDQHPKASGSSNVLGSRSYDHGGLCMVCRSCVGKCCYANVGRKEHKMKKDIYKDTLESLGGGKISAKEMSGYCQYKSRTADRYCNATCHTTCKGCRFFEPTSHAKVDILSRAALRSINDFTERLSESHELNKSLHETIAHYSEEMDKRVAQIESIRQDARVGKSIKRHRNKLKKSASGN